MRKLIGILVAGLISSAASAADTSVPNMTAGGAMSDTDLIYCAQSGGTTDRKCTGAQVKTYANTSAVRATTTTTEALANSDQNKLVTFSNAAAVACTIAQAGSGGNFAAGWAVSLKNLGAGTVTCTPTTSTVDGAANFTLTTGQGVDLYSDGTNYFTQPGKGGGGTVTTTGSPANGNLSKFSGASSITNGDLTGDCTTNGTLTANCGIPRHPGYLSGRWYHVASTAVSLAPGNALTASRLACHFGAIAGRTAITITGLGAGVNTAGSSNVQFAIYSNVSGRPGTLIGNTGNIANTSANSAATGALAANKNVGPGGSDGGAELWFCSMQNDSTATYASHPASSALAGATYGSATASEIVTGAANGMFNGIYCQAACGGGAASFGTWPADLATGTTWVNATPGSSGNIVPQVIFQVQ